MRGGGSILGGVGGVVEIFDTLILVAAIQLYLFAKIHTIVHLKKE